jgi:peptidoglycan/LPS O-acetylase OafA/YrhL
MRTIEIDGIRGWASASVLLFHVFWEMLGLLEPELRSPLLAPLLDGHLAVFVFFVLSGDALSSAFFRSGNPVDVDRLLVNRYGRLTVPILMTCSLTFLIMKSGQDYHNAAAIVVHREDWLGKFLQIAPSIRGLLTYSFIDVYVNHRSQTAYNPMLWTMSLELVGSMITFLACYLWPRLKNPALVIAFVAVFLMLLKSEYCLFLAGILLAYARSRSGLQVLSARPYWQLLSLSAVIAVGITIKSFPGVENNYVDLPASILLVLCFYTNRGFLAFFRSRISRILGDLSFPIYLVQFPVIISLMSWLLVRASREGALSRATIFTIAIETIAATLILAKIFRLLEERVLRHLFRLTLRILRVDVDRPGALIKYYQK